MSHVETVEVAPAPRLVKPGDAERFSHYVLKEAVVAAAVDGTPARALCGKVWVPTRDGEQFPICAECKRIWDTEWVD